MGGTHLIEHLAHAAVGLPAYTHNARVEALFTSFDVHGTPTEVLQHLNAVAVALDDLPNDDVEKERKVLRLEADRDGGNPGNRLRVRRHGVGTWGLLAVDELGLESADADGLRARAREVFTAHNAVLSVRGAEPTGLDLPLPQGEHRPVPAMTTSPRRSTPAWFTGPAGTVAFTGITTGEEASLAGWWWLHRCLRQRLRVQEGVVYDVDVSMQSMGRDQVEFAMAAHSRPDGGSLVLGSVQEVVAEACSTEMPAADLEAWKRAFADALPSAGVGQPSEQAEVDRLDWIARDVLSGGATTEASFAPAVTTSSDRLATRRSEAWALRPCDVRDALAELMQRSLLQVPFGTDGPADMAPVADLSDSGIVRGRVFVTARHLDGGQRLVVGEDGVMFDVAPGVQFTIPWSACAAVLRHPDGRRTVIGDDATEIDVDPSEWVRGRTAVKAVDDVAPGHLVVHLPGPEVPVQRAPRVLSGLAAMSTSVLVVLLLALGFFTLFFALASTASENPVFAWSFVALLTLGTAVLAFALVQRMRTPRAERTTLATRGRTHLAVAVDQALARSSVTTARNIAVGAWALVVVSLLIGAWHGVAFWPAGLLAAFAVRASYEATRRRSR